MLEHYVLTFLLLVLIQDNAFDYFFKQILRFLKAHLFNALHKACLIKDRSTCNYSRCGRTDKGVSAFAQVNVVLNFAFFRFVYGIPFTQSYFPASHPKAWFISNGLYEHSLILFLRLFH